MSAHSLLAATLAVAVRDLEDGLKYYEAAPISGMQHYEATGNLLGAVRIAMKKMEAAMRIDAREQAAIDAAAE